MFSDKNNLNLMLKFLEVRPSTSELGQINKALDEVASIDIEKVLERMDFLSELLSEIMSVSLSFRLLILEFAQIYLLVDKNLLRCIIFALVCKVQQNWRIRNGMGSC